MSETPLTPARLDEIRKRLESVTAEPLARARYGNGGGRMFRDGAAGERVLVMDCYDEADREFYFAAAQYVGDLLDAYDAKQQEIEAYRTAAVQMHNGLVGYGMAGAFNATLAEDGIRLLDQADALYRPDQPVADDRADVLSWKGRAESAEQEIATLREGLRGLAADLDDTAAVMIGRLDVRGVYQVQRCRKKLAALLGPEEPHD